METKVKEIASVLRSTETMADQFAKRVQERAGWPVPYAEILETMEDISAKSLTMKKVVKKLKRKRQKERAKRKRQKERAKRKQQRERAKQRQKKK